MKTTSIAILIACVLTPTIVMAQPKFVSNINGSSFIVNASNTGTQAYECVYTYAYNNNSQSNQLYSGKIFIEAGANNIAVVSRNTNQIISKLDFDFQCSEK